MSLVTDEMVEKGARAIWTSIQRHAYSHGYGLAGWEAAPNPELIRDNARVVLEACQGDIVEEFGASAAVPLDIYPEGSGPYGI
jgi:hypothetical protein